MASPRGEEGKSANLGTARRFNHLAAIENLRGESAPLNVCVFRCQPRTKWPLDVHLLERHRESTQVFVPMNASRYLVVVALGGDRPDLSTLAAFVAAGNQGVSYNPGTWHHPMIALDSVIDFACLVHEDGGERDCDVVEYPESERVEIARP